MENKITTQDKPIVQHEQPSVSPASTLEKVGTFERLIGLVKAMRPHQWTKNLALFIGLIFAQQLFHMESLLRTVIAFFVFCFASSSIYLLNDILDLQNDRKHPTKRKRPLASGRLPVSWAIAAIGVLILAAGALTLAIYLIPFPPSRDAFTSFGGANNLFTLTVVSYLLLMALYSTYLKHVVLIDVFIIASGFVIRVLAGTMAVPTYVSTWLYVVTCFLALFLALSKRRHEIILLQDGARHHRQILKEYSIPMLDQMITITVAGTLMAYSLYTIQGTPHPLMALTIPFVLYGMFRYLYLVYMRMEGGSPDEVLLRDRHMLGTVMLCVIVIIAVLYVLPQ